MVKDKVLRSNNMHYVASCHATGIETYLVIFSGAQVDDNDHSLALLLIQLVIDLHPKRFRASFVNGHQLIKDRARELLCSRELM